MITKANGVGKFSVRDRFIIGVLALAGVPYSFGTRPGKLSTLRHGKGVSVNGQRHFLPLRFGGERVVRYGEIPHGYAVGAYRRSPCAEGVVLSPGFVRLFGVIVPDDGGILRALALNRQAGDADFELLAVSPGGDMHGRAFRRGIEKALQIILKNDKVCQVD